MLIGFDFQRKIHSILRTVYFLCRCHSNVYSSIGNLWFVFQNLHSVSLFSRILNNFRIQNCFRSIIERFWRTLFQRMSFLCKLLMNLNPNERYLKAGRNFERTVGSKCKNSLCQNLNRMFKCSTWHSTNKLCVLPLF